MTSFKSIDPDRVRHPERDRFDPVTIAIHWGTLLLLAVIFAGAWALKHAADSATADAALKVHGSAGVLLWVLTLARLIWRATYGRTADLPNTVGRLQAGVARATQSGLYVLLTLQPVTGLLQNLLRGRPFELLGFSVPMLIARHRGLVKIFHGAHEIGAWALLVLIGLHAGAAIFHHLVLKDGVLRGMLPRGSGAAAADVRPGPAKLGE
jgi:cytochrome b561